MAENPQDKKDWRAKISISTYLTFIVCLMIIAVSGILGYYVFRTLKQNKYRDITAIMYLELEKQAYTIKTRLASSK